jgi:cytosine/adenosine deaminase-related metal-dependent hydrolase
LSRTVLANALVDVGGGDFRRTDVIVADGRIESVGQAQRAAGDELIDCARLAVVPGMVNAHVHSNENWFRGRFDNLPLEPWMLFSYPSSLRRGRRRARSTCGRSGASSVSLVKLLRRMSTE